MQVGIEDCHGLQSEDFMDQFGQLRPRLEVKIHLEGAPREFVQVVHLFAPGLGLPGVPGDARREPADHQGDQHEGEQGDHVGGVGGHAGRDSGWGLVQDEVAVHEDGRQRDDHRLPESTEQGRSRHNQYVKQHGDGEQPCRPVRQGRDQSDGHHSQRALQNEQQYP